MRKILLLALVIGSFSVLGGVSKANAQAAYAGNYNMLGGYTAGDWQGLYFKGYVTAVSNGSVSYSAYFPYQYDPVYGHTGYGSGVIGPFGTFHFRSGVFGKAKLVLQKYCHGYFYDSLGSGYFGLTKI